MTYNGGTGQSGLSGEGIPCKQSWLLDTARPKFLRADLATREANSSRRNLFQRCVICALPGIKFER
jgi:hypothetical protein